MIAEATIPSGAIIPILIGMWVVLLIAMRKF